MKEYILKNEIWLEMSIFIILSFFALGAILYKLLGDFDLIYDFFFMAMILLVFIIFGIYNFITITYFIEDIGKIVTINSKTKELRIKKGSEEIKVKKSDVHKSYIIESRKSWNRRDPFKLHKYATILLKGGKLLIITNLIADPLEILNHLTLSYTAIDQTFPRIDYQIGKQFSKEIYERKVEEFYASYSNKSKQELLDICSKPDVYADYAIESARRLLKKKA